MTLLDDEIPVMPGCEINDDPLDPICSACRARLARRRHDTDRVARTRRSLCRKTRDADVTIADMVGDIDPIKAARSGLQLSSELTMHYGLLPRANRGIFAINELPDLAGKIQVGLFNILRKATSRLRAIPVRLPLDVMMAFTANPEDYTARGKIITRSRIRSARKSARTILRSHRRDGDHRAGGVDQARRRRPRTECRFRGRSRRGDRVSGAPGPPHRQTIGRQPAASDLRMENVVSNAERRALTNREDCRVARVTDVYAALAVHHRQVRDGVRGELKGAEMVGRELIKAAVANVADGYLSHLETRQVSSGSTSADVCSSATR
jgi:magnesium chelatase subunit I